MKLFNRVFLISLLVAGSAVLTSAAPVPVITSPTSLVANPGVTVAYQITASNSPTGYGASGLPGTWAVNTSSGVVEGQVPAVGTVGTTMTFTVVATNAAGTSAPVTVACAVVAQAMASQQYRIGSFAAPAPVPFWASSPVLPDDTVLVTGGRILTSTVAQLDLLGNGAAGSPSLPTLSSAAWGTVQPGTATNRSVHVGIPADWRLGIYALRLVNGTDVGPSILVNAPDPWYAMGDGGCEASPGGTLYVAGHCLAYSNQTTTVALVQNGAVIASMIGTPMTTDLRGWSYAVTSSIPSTLSAGMYEVWVHNGFGGADGWAKVADPLSVIPVFTWPTNTVVFTNMPGVNDDARMLAASNALVSGGTILLPAGTLSFTSSIVLPKLCRLKGQGKTNTLLSFAGTCTSPLINSAVYPDGWGFHRDTFALEDFKIYAPTGFTGTAVQRAYQFAYLPGWMKRVDVQLDAPVPPASSGLGGSVGISVWVRQTTDFAIEDCVFDSAMPVSSLDTVSGLRVSRCAINWRDSSLYLRGMTTHVIVNDCTFNIRGNPVTNRWVEVANPNPGMWFGAFKAGLGSIGGQYIKDVLVANCVNTRDDHSYIMPGYVGYTSDGENSIYTGPFSASGTTITLPTNTFSMSGTNQLNYDWTGCRVSILDGTGAGQHRTVIAGATTNSTTLTIDRPWDVAPDSTSIIDAGCQVGNTLMINNDWSEVSLIQHYFNGVNNTVAGGTIGSSDGRTNLCIAWSGPHYQGYLPCAQMQYLSINNQHGRVDYRILCIDGSTNQPPATHYAGETGYVVRDMRESNGGFVTGTTYSGYTVGSTNVHMPVRGVLYERFPGPLTYTRLDDYGGSYAARLIDDTGTTLPTTAVRLSDSPYPLPVPVGIAPTNYAAWAAGYGLAANSGLLDSDGDGLANLLEYALGTSPIVPNSGRLTTLTAQNGQFVFRFTRPKWVTGITYTVQVSTNLVTWTNSPNQPVVESSTATNDTLTVTFAVDAAWRFMRLVVTSP